MTYKTIDEWIEHNPNHIGALPIEVCHQIWGTKGKGISMTHPEQEPVALEEKFSLLLWDYQELERAFEKVTGGKWVRKSNTPQRTWVGLTDEEIETLIHRFDGDPHTLLDEVNARLKEKNT